MREVAIGETITVADLAAQMSVKGAEVVKFMFKMGTPVTINDYLLDWAAQNPEFVAPGYVNGKDKKAEPVFDHVSSSFAEFIPDGPQGDIGGKSFTVKYTAL